MELSFGCTECEEWITFENSEPSAVVICPKCGAENTVTPSGVTRKLVMNSRNWIAECTDETYRTVQGSLREGLQKGEPTRDLAKRVQRVLPTIDRERAFIIAQTETQAACGEMSFHSLKHSSFKTKRWETCDDDLVRASHRNCKAQGAIPIDQPFDNGLMYPGDLSSGRIDECLGCRCFLAPGDEES